MGLLDGVALAGHDVWVVLGNGEGIVRIDDCNVAVRLADGRLTRAFLPVDATSTPGGAVPDDRMPLEGTVLLAEPMGNRPPDSDYLGIVLSTLNDPLAAPAI